MKDFNKVSCKLLPNLSMRHPSPWQGVSSLNSKAVADRATMGMEPLRLLPFRSFNLGDVSEKSFVFSSLSYQS